MKKILILFISISMAFVSYSQRTVTGSVSSSDGEPLIGANIIVTGTSSGTITDFDGNFSVQVPDGINSIEVSYTGFETQTVNIEGLSTISITMVEGELLSEVVVTALGVSRDEKALGYAVQEVTSQSISDANTVSAIDALAGAAAGVQVTSANGAAGSASRIVLRGQTSFNGDNQALIIVDGVRMDNSEFHSERSLAGVSNSNRAIDINPNDIENISILKGAAATALYGIEGARGVLLITTKKGSAKGFAVDVSTNLTLSNVTNIVGLQNTYLQGSNGVWQGPETGQSGSWGPNVNDASWDGSDYKHDKNGRIVTDGSGVPFVPYDNVGDVFKQGTTWSNNVAFSGGQGASNYRFSFGYSDEDGITPNNTFTRYNLGLNLGTSVFDDKLDLSFGANYINSGGTRIQQGSNTSGIMLGLLRTPISFDNSNGLSDPVNDPTAYQFPDNSQRNYRGGGGYDNPFWVVNNAPFTDDVNRFYGNINAAYHISPWLTLSTTLGTDLYSDNRVQRFEIGSRTVPGGQVIEDNYNYRHTDFYFSALGSGNITQDFTINYNVGINLYDENLKNNYIQGDGLNFFGFTELGNTSAISSVIANTNIKTAGIYGSFDFGFKNMLYLTLTGRNDWNSTLINPAEFNAGDISFFYPSASLSFVFSELLNVPSISIGKIRASYAEVGGGAPNAYSTSTAYILPIQNAGTVNDVNDGWTNGIGFPFLGQSGFVLNAVAGNPFVTPSRTKDIELGLDMRFLNNRIGFDATYYTRESGDQIIAINIANSTGFQRAIVNSGELRTVGGEVVLSLSPIRNNNLNWDIGINFSKWKTTVESLPEGVPNQYLDGFTGTGVYNIAPEDDGTKYEYGQILGGAFQRVNTPDGTFDASMPYNPDGALVIDDDISSSNYGFPLVDPVARVIGNPNPDFLLGITNTISYKDLSVSFLVDFREGGDIWNGTKGALSFFGRTELTENRGTVTVFDGVKAADGGVNDISVILDQAWYQGNGGGFGAVAEHFVEDGSFARLRYVTLTYDLGNVLKNVGFDNLNLSVTGRNLLISTPYTGFDPELSLVGGSSNGQGLDYFQLPGVKSFSVGLSARF